MPQHAHSKAAISMMRDSLQSFVNDTAWNPVDTPDAVAAIFKILQSLLEDDLRPFLTIGGGSQSLERITVYDRRRVKVIEIQVEDQPMFA